MVDMYIVCKFYLYFKLADIPNNNDSFSMTLVHWYVHNKPDHALFHVSDRVMKLLYDLFLINRRRVIGLCITSLILLASAIANIRAKIKG